MLKFLILLITGLLSKISKLKIDESFQENWKNPEFFSENAGEDKIDIFHNLQERKYF